jgi:hypothetical protein
VITYERSFVLLCLVGFFFYISYDMARSPVLPLFAVLFAMTVFVKKHRRVLTL